MSPELLLALGDGAAVVTPNRRLARFLHREFDLAQRASGRVAWPTPSILPYPQWLQALWAEAVTADAVGDSAMLLTTAQSAQQWRQVIEADVERAPLLDPQGAAALAANAWTLLHQWGAGGESWRAWSRDAADADDPAVFARWAERYAAGLRAIRARDLALVPDALAAVAGQLVPRATMFAGFVEMAPQQERLLAALSAGGSQLRRVDPLPDVAVNASRTVAATPRDEIAAALAWAREHALLRPQARIGIVVENLAQRRDEVVALAEDVLCPSAILPGKPEPVPFEISLGVALPRVPLVGAAVDLITLVESPLASGAAAALLRSPYLPGAETAWAQRACAERDWLEQGRREISLGEAIQAVRRSSPELAERWRAGREAWRSARRSTPREWADAWRAWLLAAGWPGSRPLDTGEYQAREAFERLLAEFARLGAVAPRLSPARALTALRALAGDTLFQPEGGGASIQILGVLEGTGLAFDALWVAGLTADRWPPAPSPNPLLPLAWQRDRNVPHASARQEREYAEALTASFARAAPEVVFSSASGVDDHALSPSALILKHPERPQCRRPRSWAREIAGGAALESSVDERAPPLFPGSRAPGGARLVATQSDCPFQAVARHRLGAEAWPLLCAGLAPLERGSIVHAALAAFWSKVGSHGALIALDQRTLAEEIAAATRIGLAVVPAARWRTLPSLLREGEQQRVHRLLRIWLAIERTRSPFVVQAIESASSLRLAGLEFKLRRDRVDVLAEGGLAILDYKTGKVERPKQWFDRRPRAAQLGLYTLAQRAAAPGAAVRAVAYGELRAEGAAAVGVAADDSAWPGLKLASEVGPGDTWVELEAWWRTHLEALVAEIAAGHASVTPRARPSPCRNCGLQQVCRIESVRGFALDDSEDD